MRSMLIAFVGTGLLLSSCGGGGDEATNAIATEASDSMDAAADSAADALANAADYTNATDAAENMGDASNAVENAAESNSNVVASTARLEFCDAVGQRLTRDECADLKKMQERVHTGAGVVDVPNPMTRGLASSVTLIVDRRDWQVIDAQQPGSNGPHTPTPTEVAAGLPGVDLPFAPKVGRFMSASLSGPGFEIRQVSPESPSQEIPDDGQATWTWEVTPRVEGDRTIVVRTVAEGVVGGKRYALGDGQTLKSITVVVSARDRAWGFLTDLPGWLKALAAAVTAAGVLIAAIFGLRKIIKAG